MVENDIEILLVEDNLNDVKLTLDAFREQKVAHRIQVVRDGAEALDFLFRTGAYANRSNHSPQLILLDLKLPKVTGLEVLARIRADPRTRALPVVVHTSSREEKDLVESYRLHVNSYLVKPVDFEQFSAAIREIGNYWLLLNQLPKM